MFTLVQKQRYVEAQSAANRRWKTVRTQSSTNAEAGGKRQHTRAMLVLRRVGDTHAGTEENMAGRDVCMNVRRNDSQRCMQGYCFGQVSGWPSMSSLDGVCILCAGARRVR